jgi:hypothetical protein
MKELSCTAIFLEIMKLRDMTRPEMEQIIVFNDMEFCHSNATARIILNVAKHQ